MRILIASVLFLMSGLLGEHTADEMHGWAVVYLKNEVDPSRQYLMLCSSGHPGCNTVYQYKEATLWFPTREQALDFVNGFYNDLSGVRIAKTYFNTNQPVPPQPLSADRLIGIFECKRIPIHLVKTGTHTVTVQEPKQIEQDVQEWKP